MKLSPARQNPASLSQPGAFDIDDFGLKQLPKNSGEHLFEVIMRRSEYRSTTGPPS
jgi:hypothetical protein